MAFAGQDIGFYLQDANAALPSTDIPHVFNWIQMKPTTFSATRNVNQDITTTSTGQSVSFALRITNSSNSAVAVLVQDATVSPMLPASNFCTIPADQSISYSPSCGALTLPTSNLVSIYVADTTKNPFQSTAQYQAQTAYTGCTGTTYSVVNKIFNVSSDGTYFLTLSPGSCSLLSV
ncbi:MAG: hypothetical protein EBX40_06045 [Gammaproteobacteria bacterium]|nr:hypothetical protein [Gammaproteobacteria bacterium]